MTKGVIFIVVAVIVILFLTFFLINKNDQTSDNLKSSSITLSDNNVQNDRTQEEQTIEPPSAPPVVPPTTPPEPTSAIKQFTMTAKQWEFIPETITVNEGDTVKMSIKSTDVSHGFGLPAFGINEQLQPGDTVDIEFVADKKGTFTFSCTVSCGAGHSSMDGQLIVK